MGLNSHAWHWASVFLQLRKAENKFHKWRNADFFFFALQEDLSFITVRIYRVQYNSISLMIISLVWRQHSTSVEEGRDGHAAHQILQKQTLPSDEDGHKRSQGVVER